MKKPSSISGKQRALEVETEKSCLNNLKMTLTNPQTEIDGYDVPIAFVIFNRPDVTLLTFQAIAKARPRKLFLIGDGPRSNRPGEADKVAQTRAIAQRVDWPCDVFINFSDVNLGCKNRVSSGISWVFEHADRAIILEDDCLPSKSFFSYCREMLILYESDKRVFSISGSNFADQSLQCGHSFSRYSLMWGWATWADRWAEYILYPTDHVGVTLRTWWNRPIVLAYWLLIFRNLATGKIDTWDYQWILTVWRNRALACRPSLNLVKNVGFGADATHTIIAESPLAALEAYETADSCTVCLTPMVPDGILEQFDERQWAQINIRSVLLMTFPWLGPLRASLRALAAGS